jgi:hypothetical protein
MAKSQGQLTDVVTNTSSQLSSLAQTLETFIKAQTSSKDPQGINGGGTSSAPASPALYGNIIRSCKRLDSHPYIHIIQRNPF